MRMNWVGRTLTIRRFEEEMTRGIAGLNEVVTDTRLQRKSLPQRLWADSPDGSGSAPGQRPLAAFVGLRGKERKGTANEAFGDSLIAARNPLLGMTSGYLAETLLEKIGLQSDCCNRHDQFEVHRAPKRPLAEVPMASAWVAV